MLQGVHEVLPQERIVFGRPAGDVLREEARRLGYTRVFLVTGKSVAASNHFAGIVEALGPLHAGTYAGVTAHSPRSSVIAGAAMARAARADVLVAVGGGSVIDAAKVMLLALWQGLETEASLDPFCAVARIEESPRPLPGSREPVRVIVVPTTLSAAEFTAQAGITDTAANFKHSFWHRDFTPRTVILDPDAMSATPEWLLRSTGIRAVDHCVETYCSAKAHPFSDALSKEGLGLLTGGLLRLLEEPADRENRASLQRAAWLSIAGFASGVSLGASHGIGRVLGGSYGIPHGRTSCIMLPATLRWNRLGGDATILARQDTLQKVMAEVMPGAGPHLADSIEQLVRRLGEPVRLHEISIGPETFPDIAEKAMIKLAHPSVAANARPVRSPQDVAEILAIAR
jgi:maleylacetate reductase